MGKITENEALDELDLTVLRYTRHISDLDLSNPKWALLKAEYDELQNGKWINQVLLSLVNSIVHQQRAVFVLSRRRTRELLANDKNWAVAPGLKNANWANVISVLLKRKFVEIIHKAPNGAWVFQVTAPWILELIDVPVQQQINQTITFANQLRRAA